MTDKPASEPQASEREAALHELLLEIEMHCPCGARPESTSRHPHVSGCPVEKALRLIGQPAPRPDALTLERVRAVLAEHSCTVAVWSHPQVKTKCKCGWERRHVLADADRTWLLWIEHILALLAAPRTENP